MTVGVIFVTLSVGYNLLRIRVSRDIMGHTSHRKTATTILLFSSVYQGPLCPSF